jgi:hypothetical protein
MYYIFANNSGWIDGIAFNLESERPSDITALSTILAENYEVMLNKPHFFRFSKELSDQFDQSMKNILKETRINYGQAIDQMVYRLGLTLYRVCMVLTALRNMPFTNQTIECNEIDLDIALQMVTVLIQHSIMAFLMVPGMKDTKLEPSKDKLIRRAQLLNKLPTVFKRESAIAYGKQVGLKDRTVDTCLKDKNLFEKIEYGYYRKITA